ncbi:filamentous hemagglutinin N-terminal domain-containing protein, partial [Paludibacterium sp.]|uniref:two-partner secretion domain-containing protein n=1 Tax=Paludibacterium sp. TaxID=1917523 RepID=UPI0025FA4FD2
MNRHLYRIVFNRVRGQLMAVAETVAAQHKAGERGPGSAPAGTFALRALSFAAMLALGSAALADGIAADGGAPAGKQPTVTQAANGVPLVQIAAPNGAGVSHNQYQQFNVGGNGAILNNSAVIVNTQLGGYVNGNANLKNGSARVILNEVTQANPSLLKGFVEVAGQRADVVIANPWGITCSGCGFINTARATLTTGTPVFDGQGNLARFHVSDGQVSVDSLDASQTDSFAILTRALKVNGDLHANDLQIRLGRNDVDAATLSATPLAADPAATPAPQLALDVAALGGMYANAIHLIGTEKGVGVNSAGTLLARQGDLQLSSSGDLTLAGAVLAQHDANVHSDGTLQQQGSLLASHNAQLNAAVIQAQGNLLAGVDGNLQFDGDGTLTVSATTNVDAHGTWRAASGIVGSAPQWNLTGADLRTPGTLALASTGVLNTAGTTFGAGQRLQVSADQVVSTNSAWEGGQLDLAARTWQNDHGALIQDAAVDGSLNVSGALSNLGGSLLGQQGNLTVHAASLDNRQGGQIDSAGNLSLTVDGQLQNDGGWLASGQQAALTLQAG